MGINNMAIVVAIALSFTASIISVFGLAAIFSGSFWEVIGVASILEIAKVITATWIHRYWNTTSQSLKVYLSGAVVILMFITSLGIYGFFSKAHIEQQVAITTGDSSRVSVLETKLNNERSNLDNVNRQLGFIEASLKSLSGVKALAEAEKQKKSINTLTLKRDEIQEKIIKLETEKSLLDNSVKKQEIKVGPLKYLANLYYGSANHEQLEVAVRMLILVIVFVFDPLALALIIAAGSRNTKTPSMLRVRRRRVNKTKDPKVTPLIQRVGKA
jgi:hypothetical protein